MNLSQVALLLFALSIILVIAACLSLKPVPAYLAAVFSIPLSFYFGITPVAYHIPLLFPPLITLGGLLLHLKLARWALFCFISFLTLLGLNMTGVLLRDVPASVSVRGSF